MLMGIVKPNGDIVFLDGLCDPLREAIEKCFEYGLSYGVNENGQGIISELSAEIPVILPDSKTGRVKIDNAIIAYRKSQQAGP